MLKLTKKADYGLIAMRHLAEHADLGACSANGRPSRRIRPSGVPGATKEIVMPILWQCAIAVVVGMAVLIATHLYTRPEVSSSARHR